MNSDNQASGDQHPPPREKFCVACAASIPEKSQLCRHCRSFQSNWKNVLLYASQITTLVAATVAAVVFLVARAPEVRRALWWRDSPRVLAFKSNQEIIVANHGDGPIYVTHIALTHDLSPFGQRTTTQRLDLAVPASDVRLKRITPDTPGGAKYVGGISDDIWRVAVERAFDGSSRCFWPLVALRTDASFLQIEAAYQSRGEPIRTFPASAVLYYYSLGSGEVKSLPLEVAGTIVFRDTAECTER